MLLRLALQAVEFPYRLGEFRHAGAIPAGVAAQFVALQSPHRGERSFQREDCAWVSACGGSYALVVV
jgi:hypothetical protein